MAVVLQSEDGTKYLVPDDVLEKFKLSDDEARTVGEMIEEQENAEVSGFRSYSAVVTVSNNLYYGSKTAFPTYTPTFGGFGTSSGFGS